MRAVAADAGFDSEANHELAAVNHANQDHGLAIVGQFFVVLTQASIPSKPTERAFDDPAFGQHLEPLGVVVAFDDLQDPSARLLHPANELSRIAAVGPNELESRQRSVDCFQHQLGAVAILHVRRMNDDAPNQTERVDQQMPLAPLHLLAGVVAATRPLFSVVFTDWLSMIAALGRWNLPCFRRTRRRIRS